MSEIVLFAVVVLALAVSGFCSGSETGFMSVSRGRILHLVRSGGMRAGIVQRALSDMGRTTITLLVGNNLANVVYSSASSALSLLVFPDSPRLQAAWGAAAAIGILFLGEFLPKLFFSASPLRRIIRVAPAWRIFERVFSPAAVVVLAAVNWLLPKREASAKVTPDTVLKILQDRKDGVRISDFESAMIGRIMVLRSKGQAVTPESLLKVLDEDDQGW